MKELWQLFFAFFKIGGLTFGGGLTMLPMLKYELVEQRGWISEDDLLDCYAIGQCTPGIIAINTATFVGYRKRGIWGGIFATMGMVVPSLVIITVIAMFLENFMDNPIVGNALMGVRAVVCALMLNTVIILAKKSLIDKITVFIFIIATFSALFLPIPTIAVVIGAALVGILIKKWERKRGKVE